MSQPVTRTASRDIAEIPPDPGKIIPIAGSKHFLYLYNSNNLGTKKTFPLVDTSPQGVETPTPLGYD